MMSVGFSSLPVDLLDRLVEARSCRRSCRSAIDEGTARDDAEHVAFVHQLLRDPLEQIADAAGVVELQVQVVDEEQEDAARRRRSAAATAAE